jgi:alanine dehydrogenase
VIALADKGYRRALMEDQWLREGLNVHKGKVTQREVAHDLDYDYHDAEEVLRHD